MRLRDAAPSPMPRRAAPGKVVATLGQSFFHRQSIPAATLQCPPPPARLPLEPRLDEVGPRWPTARDRVPLRGQLLSAPAATCPPVRRAGGGCAQNNKR